MLNRIQAFRERGWQVIDAKAYAEETALIDGLLLDLGAHLGLDLFAQLGGLLLLSLELLGGLVFRVGQLGLAPLDLALDPGGFLLALGGLIGGIRLLGSLPGESPGLCVPGLLSGLLKIH